MLGSRPAGERVGVEVAGIHWCGLNVWISRGSVCSPGGSQSYGKWEQNGAARCPLHQSGSCREACGIQQICLPMVGEGPVMF